MTGQGHSRVVLGGVRKSFDRVPVLDDCAFELKPGQFTTLIGPSGCGKTTIIDLIAGYDKPDEGTITLDGQPIRGPSWERLVVFQETALFPWKTILRNVVFGPLNRGANRKETDERARALLAKLGLAGFEEKYSNQLSGGMQRRAELARALINNPRIMLLDEPFRGLDAMTRELMQEYVLKLFESEPVTTLFVTTEIEEAIFLSDEIIFLTSVPARVKRIIPVDLPRPRSIKMLSTPRFAEIHGQILEDLLEEARKSFADGMAGAADLVEAFGQATRDRS